MNPLESIDNSNTFWNGNWTSHEGSENQYNQFNSYSQNGNNRSERRFVTLENTVEDDEIFHEQQSVSNHQNGNFNINTNGNGNLRHLKSLRKISSSVDAGALSSADNNAAGFGNSQVRGWFELDMSGMGLRTLSPEIRHFNHITALYLSNNRLLSLSDDIFLELKSLNTLDLSFNLLNRIPIGITFLSLLERLSLHGNRLTDIPVEMGRLWKLRELDVEGNPIISPPLTIIQSGTETLISYLRDRMPMGPPPPERRFISYIDSSQANTIPDKDRIRVMSYNILADQYATPEMYFYCPSWALDWNYRKQGILKEILAFECDVICLQEVEAGQFQEFFQPELSRIGYSGVFAPKSRARTMDVWNTVDGCATFYKRTRFMLLEEQLVEFQSIAMAKHKEFSEDPEAFSRVITKDNIASVVVLQLKEDSTPNRPTNSRASPLIKASPRHLLISNTHIHWNPEHCDVKLIQVQMLLEQLANVTHNPKSKYQKIPMVLCGDYNSSVDSGPYELLGSSRLKPHHADLDPYNYGAYSQQGMSHPFSLSSAYATIGEPPFTNYTGDFTGVLDYLWYTNDSLGVSKVLQPVDEEVVKVTRMPNVYMNSDHISLLSEFYFKKK